MVDTAVAKSVHKMELSYMETWLGLIWDIALCSPLKVTGHFREHVSSVFRVRGLSACHLLSHWSFALAYSSALKMEATYSSETRVEFQWTTWPCIPEDRSLITTAVRTSKILHDQVIYMIFLIYFGILSAWNCSAICCCSLQLISCWCWQMNRLVASVETVQQKSSSCLVLWQYSTSCRM